MGAPENKPLLSERNKAILVVLMVLMLLGSTFFLQGLKHHKEQKDAAIVQDGEQIDRFIKNIEQYVFEPYKERIISLIQSSRPVGDALFHRDRQRLYQIVLSKNQALKRESNFFRVFRFHLPDGSIFLDMTEPLADRNTANDIRPMALAVHKLQKQVSGFDLNTEGLYYRILQPLFFQNSYAGALEFGILAYPVITDLLTKEKVTGTFFMRSDIIKATGQVHADQWRQAGPFVYQLQDGSSFSEIITQLSPDHHMMECSLRDQTYITHSHELFHDFQGKPLGGIMALQDIAPLVMGQRTFIFESLLFTSSLVIISMLVLVISFNQLLGKLERSRAGLRQSVKDMHQAKEEWERTFDAIDDIITIIDPDFRIRQVNRATCTLLHAEPEEFVGKHCYELFESTGSPCKGCTINEVKREGIAANFEIEHAKLNKTFLVSISPVLDENGRVETIVHYAKDITEYKLLEAQFRQAQKLEAIGRLTGGVAHDFNNLLTTIIGYSDLALAEMGLDTDIRDNKHKRTYEVIFQAGEKAAALTRQLLAFSRQQVLEMHCVDLNDIVEQLAKMLYRLVGEHIELKLKLGADIGTILADPIQIEQIVMNLVVNAKDAMLHDGQLAIETETIRVEESYAEFHRGLVPGIYVQLTVSDTGIGMTKEIQEKIFDPFFTTKELGKGTGLGLATIYGIVKQHKGYILIYSEPGVGTTFKIYFPVFVGDAEEYSHQRPGVLPQGTETVMVVDDEADIRTLLVNTLEPLGYRVITAATGQEAIRLCTNHDEKIDILLTDVIMPGINGKEVANKITEVSPTTRVVFMSGYPNEVISYQKVLEQGTNFISKPIVPSQLSIRIREILDKNKVTKA